MQTRHIFFSSLAIFAAIAVLGIGKKVGLWGHASSTTISRLADDASAGVSEQSSSSLKPLERVSHSPPGPPDTSRWPLSSELLPNGVDRTAELFDTRVEPLPIVELIRYSPNTSWSPHKAAWLGDYAAHFSTSKHFISRSLTLNQPLYDRQNVSVGDRFNVLRRDKPFEFYLLVDTSRSKIWFYYKDLQTNQKTLIKTYSAGLGRLSNSAPSGLLTPLGKFRLGSKIVVYRPGSRGIFKRKEVEMIRVFGSRWIPLEGIEAHNRDLSGYGLHGTPWLPDDTGRLREDLSEIGSYTSDGCIRLSTSDIEELFAIVVTRPTIVEIVHDFCLADYE